MKIIKSTNFLTVASLALSTGLCAQQRIMDLELSINSPVADETYQTGVALPLVASVMNHGPEDLVAGDTLFIHLPNNTVQPIILGQGIPEGQTNQVISTEITFTVDSTVSFDFCMYLYDNPSEQIRVGNQSLSLSYVDSDSTNNTVCNKITVSAGTQDSSSSIADFGAAVSQLALYPNPATSWVTFPVNDLSLSGLQVNIIDLAGRPIQTTTSYTVSGIGQEAQVRLDLPELKPGIYIIEVLDGSKKTFGKVSIAP